MDDESGESMELMEEVPLKELGESELERSVRGCEEKPGVDSRDEGKHTGSGVTATPGAPAPPEGPRVLGAPARDKEKNFLFTFRLVNQGIKIYKILNFTCG